MLEEFDAVDGDVGKCLQALDDGPECLWLLLRVEHFDDVGKKTSATEFNADIVFSVIPLWFICVF